MTWLTSWTILDGKNMFTSTVSPWEAWSHSNWSRDGPKGFLRSCWRAPHLEVRYHRSVGLFGFKYLSHSFFFFWVRSRPSRPFRDWSLLGIRPTSSPRPLPSSTLLSGSLPNRRRSNMKRTRPMRTCPWPSIWPGWIAVDLRPWSVTWLRWWPSWLTLCLMLDWKRSSRVGFDAWWWPVPGIIWWTQRIHTISVNDWDVNWSSLRAVVMVCLLKNPRDTIGWSITISVTAYLIAIHFNFIIT